jgi:hypothetical protein
MTKVILKLDTGISLVVIHPFYINPTGSTSTISRTFLFFPCSNELTALRRAYRK